MNGIRRKIVAVFLAAAFCALVTGGIVFALRFFSVRHLEQSGVSLSEWRSRFTGKHLNDPDPATLSFGGVFERITGYPESVAFLNSRLSPDPEYEKPWNLSAADIRCLRRLGPVTGMRFFDARGLTPASVAELSRISSLRDIDLANCDITDEGFNLLWRSLPHLERIMVDNCPIGDEGLRDVASARKLQILVLFAPNIGDTGVERLRELPELSALNLAQTGVTEASVESLASMPALREVHLPATTTGQRMLEKLLVLKPNISVIKD